MPFSQSSLLFEFAAVMESTVDRPERLYRNDRLRRRAAKQSDKLAPSHIASQTPPPPWYRRFGLLQREPTSARRANPWGRPESFLIQVGATRRPPVLPARHGAAGGRCIAGYDLAHVRIGSDSVFRRCRLDVRFARKRTRLADL